MKRLTAGNLVSFINQLNKDVAYNYINPKNKGLIRIVGVDLPEGPIRIRRWIPSKGKIEENAKIESISTEMIWRIANYFQIDQPINVDRIFGGSYNTRSVLETLIAHCPEFYYCYPGRIENKGGETTTKHGHKHLVWKPSQPHQLGKLIRTDTNIVISEMPAIDAYYDSLVLPISTEPQELNIEQKRRHAQIQIALYFIGRQLNFKTWIALNDRGIIYQDKPIAEYEGVIGSLRDVQLMKAYDEAIQAALLIDCIWFQNGRLMPAVLEVEHSTGVTSGLTRMKNFMDKFPPFPTRYVIVAPDELRSKVFKEGIKPQFKELETKFFPYSAVEELYALCQKRKIRGVSEEFLDSFMESVK